MVSLGRWAGFYVSKELYPCDDMLALNLQVSSANPKQFQDSGIAANGTDWTLSGEYMVDPEGGKVTYAFTITYKARWITESFRGELKDTGTELSGTYGYGAKPTSSESSGHSTPVTLGGVAFCSLVTYCCHCSASYLHSTRAVTYSMFLS